jgi:hypothetical protein
LLLLLLSQLAGRKLLPVPGHKVRNQSAAVIYADVSFWLQQRCQQLWHPRTAYALARHALAAAAAGGGGVFTAHCLRQVEVLLLLPGVMQSLRKEGPCHRLLHCLLQQQPAHQAWHAAALENTTREVAEQLQKQ